MHRRFPRLTSTPRPSLFVCDFLCPSVAHAAVTHTTGATPHSTESPHATSQRQGGVFFARIHARHRPPSSLPQSRRLSTAAAATKDVGSHFNHHASHSHYSPNADTVSPGLPWQHSSEAVTNLINPAAGLDSYPSHWLSPWQSRKDASADDRHPDSHFVEAFADARKEFAADSKEHSEINGWHRRRLAGHRLWDLYLQHAHKERLSLPTRVSVANALAVNAHRVTTNKVSSVQSQALRYLIGRRIGAILQDCQLVIAKKQIASRSTESLMAHKNLGVALLQPISIALQAQPISALSLMDQVLLHCRPDIYRYKSDSQTPVDYLLPINITFRTIVDSINSQTHCRASADMMAHIIKSQPRFFQDTRLLTDLMDGKVELPQVDSPIKESLEWFVASPHAFLLSHEAFRNPRSLYLHCLSQAKDPHRILDELNQKHDPEEPGFAQACDLLLRSAILYHGSEAALHLYDDMWSRGVPLPSELLNRLIHESSGQASSAHLELLLHRASNEKAAGRMSKTLLRNVTMGWAMRNRPDRVYALLASLRRRSTKGYDKFARLCFMQLAAVRGDIKTLHEKLAEVYDFNARHTDECESGKTPLTARAYGLLIKACSRTGDVDLAEFYLTEALERGVPPRSSDFNHLIDMYARRANIDAALAIFEQMKDCGVQPDKYTYTILIHGFASRRDPDSAAHALRAMVAAGKTPDRVTYAALLNCYIDSGLYGPAIRLFAWMRDHSDVRLRPTIEVCNIILKAYVLSSLPVQKIMKFVDTVRKMDLVPNANTYALMLQSACDAGFMDLAEEIFSEAERVLPRITGSGPGQGANLYHFTIMIRGYLRLGDHREAKEYFDEMQSRKLQPSAITWSIMVHSYAHSENEANYELACTLVSQLIADESKKTFRPSSWNIPASGSESDKTRNTGGFSQLAAKHSPPFETLYNVLMVAQARRGEPEQVEKTLKIMARSDPDLSVYAMTPLLDAYRRAGDVDSALRLFDQIYEAALESVRSKSHRVYAYSRTESLEGKSGATSSRALTQRRQDASSRNMLCLPVSIMIDLLSTAGRHEEVAKMWARAKNDGFGFDSDNWNHLAASMARAGQLNEALSVVEHVLYHDPPNAWTRTRVDPDALKPSKPGRESSADDVEADDVAARLGKDAASGAPGTMPVDSKDFDPLPQEAQLDPAAGHRSDAASTPSHPPNRRHQSRSDDDPYAKLPFDQPEPVPTTEEEDSDGEVEEEKYTEPGAFWMDARTGNLLTRDLSNYADRFSPWYAHFETMEAVSRGLAKIGETQKVLHLLDKHPSAAALLDLHERKVEIIHERKKEEAVRSARDIIDGRAWT